MIDIGHVDLEYEWMKNGVLQQEKVKGKIVMKKNGKNNLITKLLRKINYYSHM